MKQVCGLDLWLTRCLTECGAICKYTNNCLSVKHYITMTFMFNNQQNYRKHYRLITSSLQLCKPWCSSSKLSCKMTYKQCSFGSFACTIALEEYRWHHLLAVTGFFRTKDTIMYCSISAFYWTLCIKPYLKRLRNTGTKWLKANPHCWAFCFTSSWVWPKSFKTI